MPLTRSAHDRLLGGVCGGIASRYGIDVTLVRVIVAVAGLGTGLALLGYIALWILLPLES